MESRWNDSEAAKYSDPVELRAYSSRMLGADSDLVLHGGGNTSVKVERKNFFGEQETILYVKGSGYDLATIPKEGFSPVRLDVLLKLAALDELSDTDMVREQRVALIDPGAPNPSVEAILHGLIPFKFVDHTHTDAVVTITNNKNREAILSEIYGDDILILPYAMPGFVLAKQVYQATKDIDWSKLKGIILLNHGVFTFHDDAKTAYANMIDIVSRAEDYIRAKTDNNVAAAAAQFDPIKLATLRSEMSRLMGKPMLAKFNDSESAAGFAKLDNIDAIANRGPVTPDHIIHTKQVPLIAGDKPLDDLNQFVENYENYFRRNNDQGLTQLDPLPRWSVFKGEGTVAFGPNIKRVNVVHDISEHTVKCIQYGEGMGGWHPLDEKNLFEVEYWELEQAKLKKKSVDPEFMGKVAVVTGAASGIGRAIAEKFVADGACVLALDINPEISDLFSAPNTMGIVCDVTDNKSIEKALSEAVKNFGGIDIVVSNAGSFPPGAKIESLDNEVWDKVIKMNLTSHQRVMKAAIPYLKLGVDPTFLIVASKNVPAPGPGASAYSAAKAGLTQLGRVSALELGECGIRVNMIHPNQVFDTGIWTEEVLQQRASHYGLSIDEYKRNNILKAEVTSKDVADLVAFMSSKKFLKTTGAQIPIDGGNERVI